MKRFVISSLSSQSIWNTIFQNIHLLTPSFEFKTNTLHVCAFNDSGRRVKSWDSDGLISKFSFRLQHLMRSLIIVYREDLNKWNVFVYKMKCFEKIMMKWQNVSFTTAAGFEPTRECPNGFQVHHLNHSVKQPFIGWK